MRAMKAPGRGRSRTHAQKPQPKKKKKKQNDNSNNTNILCLFFQAYELDFQCKLRSRAVIMPDIQIYNFELLGN